MSVWENAERFGLKHTGQWEIFSWGRFGKKYGTDSSFQRETLFSGGMRQ